MGVYALREGLLDRFKKKKNNDTDRLSQSEKDITDEEKELAKKKAIEIFGKHFAKLTSITKKEINKSDFCKKNFIFMPFDSTVFVANIYCEKSKRYKWVVDTCFIKYNLWDIFPNAREVYNEYSDPNLLEMDSMTKKVDDAVNAYCKSNNIPIICDFTYGDWDTVLCCLYIPLDKLDIKVNESTIFSGIEFI